MLFILPFVPVATPRTIKGESPHYAIVAVLHVLNCPVIHSPGRTGVYFKALILISTLTSISHGIFEIIIQTQGSEIIERCGLTEIILRHIGFVQLGGLP